MMELLFFALFIILLFICLAGNISVVYGLLFSLVAFFVYAIIKKNRFINVLRMVLIGIKDAKGILLSFVFIGFVTAMWRASGTIPTLVIYMTSFIPRKMFFLLIFFMNAIMSILLGTAFGTSATMGVISITMAIAMGYPVLISGGAILSGIYVGDRLSPVSSTCCLMADLCGEKMHTTLKIIGKSMVVPFLVAVLFYGILGLFYSGNGEWMDIEALFSQEFIIGIPCVIPAVVILIMSLFHLNGRLTLLCSSLAAFLIALFYQGQTIAVLLKELFYGFSSTQENVASLLNGGGVSSMINAGLIVALGSGISGIIQATGMLSGILQRITTWSKKITTYLVFFLVSIFVSIFSCSQTLTIIIVWQLLKPLKLNNEKNLVLLAQASAVVCTWFPWSTPLSVPVANMNIPWQSLFFAVLILVGPCLTACFEIIKEKNMDKKSLGLNKS